MFEGRLMKKTIGTGLALFGVFLMLGTGGAVEAGSISIGMAFVRMIIGCVMILGGASEVLE